MASPRAGCLKGTLGRDIPLTLTQTQRTPSRGPVASGPDFSLQSSRNKAINVHNCQCEDIEGWRLGKVLKCPSHLRHVVKADAKVKDF